MRWRGARPVLMFVALGLTWGSSFLCIRVAVEAVSPWQLSLLRVAVGALVLVIVALVLHRPWPRGLRPWWRIVVLAAFGTVLPFTAYAYAGLHIPSGLSSIYNAGVPVVTALMSLIALRSERVARLGVLGMLIGTIGILVVLAPWRWADAGGFDILGQLACLVAVLGNGFAFVWTRRMLAPLGVDPIAVTAAQMAVATLIQLCYAPWLDLTPVALDWAAVICLVLLGAGSSGIAYVWSFRVIAHWGASAASMVTYLVTFVGVVLGAWLLGERFETVQLLGGAVVLLGVAFGVLGSRRRAQALSQSGSGPITS